MSLIVNIKNTDENNSDEYQAALELKEIFEKSNANGEVWIFTSTTLRNALLNDVDLIVLGYFNSYKEIIDCKTDKDNISRERNVVVKGFCTVVELKKHDASRIKYSGEELLVRYSHGVWHSATKQCENEKYSLVTLFNDRDINPKPIVTNLIWLYSVDQNNINDYTNGNASNLLPHTFTLNYFITQLAKNKILVHEDERSNSFLNLAYKDQEQCYKNILKIFTDIKVSYGNLTRKRLEMIDAQQLENKASAEKFLKEQKLHLFKGKAGTGKTILLLRLACALAMDFDKRCKILTYNHALVSDMRRTLKLAHIEGGDDERTVQIDTLHSFFISIMNDFGTCSVESDDYQFEKHYSESLKETNVLIDNQDIARLKSEHGNSTDWDYIFVDEAQDWKDDEKLLLFKIYGPNCIVVADGIDQFMRQGKRQLWGIGINAVIDKYNKSLRQKANIVQFVNEFAKAEKLSWEIKPLMELLGGNVIVSTYYDSELHNKLMEECKQAGNDAYDILFLTPPQLVDNGFKLIDAFNDCGIHIFDGTKSDLRGCFPINNDMCRLFQYDSCRGLEGWTVICFNFDQLIQYKMEQLKQEAGIDVDEQQIYEQTILWALMPLTRAIDTLVITIDNTESEIYKVLYKIANKNNDIVELLN